MIIAVSKYEHQSSSTTWEYGTAYQAVPSLMLTLGQDTYTGNFGRPPYVEGDDCTSATVTPNNGGGNLFCAAVGFPDGKNDDLRIEYGVHTEDKQFEQSFLNHFDEPP